MLGSNTKTFFALAGPTLLSPTLSYFAGEPRAAYRFIQVRTSLGWTAFSKPMSRWDHQLLAPNRERPVQRTDLAQRRPRPQLRLCTSHLGRGGRWIRQLVVPPPKAWLPIRPPVRRALPSTPMASFCAPSILRLGPRVRYARSVRPGSRERPRPYERSGPSDGDPLVSVVSRSVPT